MIWWTKRRLRSRRSDLRLKALRGVARPNWSEIADEVVRLFETDPVLLIRLEAAELLLANGPKPSIESILRLLEGKRFDSLDASSERSAAIRVLAASRDLKAVSILAGLHRYCRNEEEGLLVVKALAAFEEPSLIPILLRTISEHRPKERAEIERMLKSLGEASVEPLTVAMQAGTYYADRFLVHVGGPRAVSGFVEALREWKTRTAAACALREMGWVPANREQRVLFALGLNEYDKAIAEGPDAIPHLLAELQTVPSPLVLKITDVLSGTNDPSAIATVARFLFSRIEETTNGDISDYDARSHLRGQYIAALCKTKNLETLRKVLSLRNVVVGIEVPQAIADLGTGGLSALANALTSPEFGRYTRGIIVRTLERAGWRPISDTERAWFVMSRWWPGDNDPSCMLEIRRFAKEGTGKLAETGAGAIGVLLALTKEFEHWERSADTAECLRRILEQDASSAEEAALRGIVSQEDLLQSDSITSDNLVPAKPIPISLANVRQMARQELARRGLAA